MTLGYKTTPGDDGSLRGRMKAIAQERRRFGHRRLHRLLRREGFEVNHKRLFRLYRGERLTVRRRGGHERAIGTRAPMMIPLRLNERWSRHFVDDQMTDGRRFRILAIVDDCIRGCLVLVADPSLSVVRVARELDRLRGERRHAEDDRERQWQRADLQRHLDLGWRSEGRVAFHLARQTDAKWIHRELQWSPAG